MAGRRPGPGHLRLRGRGAREAAYVAALADLAAVRADRYADQLELARLGALAHGLGEQVTRLNAELAVLRRELRDARAAAATAPAAPARGMPAVDPYVAVLSDQVGDLRRTLTAQQGTLTDLTSRLLALLERGAAVAAPAAPEPAPGQPREPAEPTTVVLPVAPATASIPDSDELDEATMMRLRLIRASFGA